MIAGNSEGSFAARVLLFIPSQPPPEMYRREAFLGGLRLYVKRVLFYQGSYASLYGLPLDNAPPVASLPVAEPRP